MADNNAYNKYEYIDAVRGYATLMVIAVHLSQRLDMSSFLGLLAEYGQMGVQLFFIASAYTLSLSYERRINEKYSLLNFLPAIDHIQRRVIWLYRRDRKHLLVH